MILAAIEGRVFVQRNFFDVMKRNMRLRFVAIIFIPLINQWIYSSIAGIDLNRITSTQIRSKYPFLDNSTVPFLTRSSVRSFVSLLHLDIRFILGENWLR